MPSKGFEQGMALSELQFGGMSGCFAESSLKGSKSWENTNEDIAVTQSKDRSMTWTRMAAMEGTRDGWTLGIL